MVTALLSLMVGSTPCTGIIVFLAFYLDVLKSFGGNKDVAPGCYRRSLSGGLLWKRERYKNENIRRDLLNTLETLNWTT